MKTYEHASVDDLTADERFQAWVRQPSPEEEVFWSRFLLQNPQKKKEVETARALVQALHFSQPAWPAERRRRVWRAIEASTQAGTLVRPLRQRPLWYRAAAVVGLALLVGVALWRWAMPEETQVATDYGQTQTISLPDGSTAVLNARSSLRFAANWDEADVREVWLDGEAFFSVQKKARPGPAGPKPLRFVVHTRDLAVEVLGTQFNVNNRRAETRVVLASGKIKLDLRTARPRPPLLMVPGDLVEFSSKKDSVVRLHVNPALYDSWRNQRWLLENTPLREVARRMEETYGLQVRISGGGTAERTVSGSFPSDNLDILLRSLSTTLDLRIERHDQHIQVNP